MPSVARADLPAVLAALTVLAVFAWWMADGGGYAPAAWMPGLVVVAIVTGAVVCVAARRPSRATLVACAALAAYTAWSFASILWAQAPGDALEGSQRTLLYLLCFACFALLPWTPRALLAAVGLLVLAATVLGVATVVQVAQAADPARLLFESRLTGPLGYPNASAALWTAAALAALVLASRPETRAWLRPLFLGSSGVLLGLALMTHSRGWLFTLPLLVLVLLALVPGRARLLLFAAPLAAVLALVASSLLEPYRAGADAAQGSAATTLAAAFDDAAGSLLLAGLALVVLGAAAVWLDGVVRRRALPSQRAGRILTATLLACTAAAGIAATLVVTDGRPLERAERAWSELRGYSGEDGQANRFTTLGSNRYDLWRVAWAAWREQPAGGLGQDNFAQTYVRERANSFDEPRWVHSLPLRLLAHTGLAGALLFALFAVAAVWAAVAAWSSRAAPPGARAAGSVALLPAAVWLVHGSVDWLWEFPGLTGPALAFAGAAAGLARGAPGDAPARAVSRVRPSLACVAALACVAIVVPSAVAERDIRAAAGGWPADPGRALERLERARSLNSLSARPAIVEGVIAAQSGRLARADVSFRRAVAREPANWFARFGLGLVAGARGDHDAALAHLLAAQRLNARERLTFEALKLARAGDAMSLAEAQRDVNGRIARRLGTVQDAVAPAE